MKTNIIYTLDWVKKEADIIGSYWNGKDAKYIDGNGDERTPEEADLAAAILERVKELEELITELGI